MQFQMLLTASIAGILFQSGFNNAKPTESVKVETAQQTLKSWIPPTGNNMLLVRTLEATDELRETANFNRGWKFQLIKGRVVI